MHVIHAKSAQDGLRQGVEYLHSFGHVQHTRNGNAVVAPGPVTTVFENPNNSIIWSPERDYNIAFTLYESLWMLEGRKDVLPLTRYVKRIYNYSDDGYTLHGSSYGHRWRKYFDKDQLDIIIKRLKTNPNDRRAVLGMWDPRQDLQDQDNMRDLPCNLIITFSIAINGELDMTVFNRSNDIYWGTYFANAFHFGMLHNYISSKIGRPMGRYYQISNNYHLYENFMDKVKAYIKLDDDLYLTHSSMESEVTCLNDEDRKNILRQADLEILHQNAFKMTENPYHQVLLAHELYRKGQYTEALIVVSGIKHQWTIAMIKWLKRRTDA